MMELVTLKNSYQRDHFYMRAKFVLYVIHYKYCYVAHYPLLAVGFALLDDPPDKIFKFVKEINIFFRL